MNRGFSEQEKHEFVAWMNQSKLHREVLMNQTSMWDDLSALKELNGLFPIETTTKNKANTLFNFVAAAGIFFATFTSASLLMGGDPFAIFIQSQQRANVEQFSTNIGEQATFTLHDGTNLQLNTDTLVEVSYTANHRQLTLIKGEAKFDVVKDKKRPFTVTAANKSFTALGTIFNVQKNSASDVELLVTEGKVLITESIEIINNIGEDLPLIELEHLTGTLVQSGEKAIIINSVQAPVNRVSLDQVQKELAWQQGMLIFDGDTLENALEEVNRYTEIRFELQNEKLANLKVSGYFKAGDIDVLLESLRLNFDIHYQKYANNIINLSYPQH
jgi:transmembrane sensor